MMDAAFAQTTTPERTDSGAQDPGSMLRETLSSVRTALSHDLRSPLRAIDGYSRVLREDYAHRLDEEGRVLLERSAAASDRIAAMIDGLIGHVRLTQAPIAPRPLDLSAMAFEIASELRSSGCNAHIEIEPGMTATGDEVLMRRALTLLLRVATERAALSATPKVRFYGVGDRAVDVFFIEDSGPVLGEVEASRAFEPFAFASSVPSADLGWGDVRLIVQRHGGAICAELTPKGTTAVRFQLEPQGP